MKSLLPSLLALSLPALLAPICAQSLIGHENIAQAGRRMLPIDVPKDGARTLVGKAPEGAGAPFRVLLGDHILWEGQAGEEFSLSIPAEYSTVYLFAQNANNLAWQQLRWSKEKASSDAYQYPAVKKKADASHDFCRPLRSLIQDARKQGEKPVLKLHRGVYHFYPEGAHQMSYYTSNHDQQDTHPVGVPLVDIHGLTLDGQGSTFVFHGKMQPFLLLDSSDITIKNINIAYDTAYSTEAVITEISPQQVRVRIPSSGYSWKVENERFFNTGHLWQEPVQALAVFKPNGRMAPLYHAGDISWSPRAEKLGDNEVLFHQGFSPQSGVKKGDTLILRNYSRPHPAMVIYRSKGVALHDVVFHDAQGMALLAQRSEDITIRGGGCLRREGRMHTTGADATHFSNCRGKIDVQGATYESMMDDAINVHSTCLSITEVVNPREIISRYMHPQAVGFEVALAGETLQFIHGPTLQNNPQLVKVKEVIRLDERHVRLILEEDLPEGIGVGDAWENADWYPSVHFAKNLIRWNRARGSLFTTPKPVLVEDNKFDWGSGSAILLAGDAQGWYESGRCLDVTIRGNMFIHNLTSGYQFTEGIISIYPEVKQPQNQTEPYHQNILIEDNYFLTHRVPLIFAISAKGITFRNNEVVVNDQYPARHEGKAFVLKHCPPDAIKESGTRRKDPKYRK